MDDARVVDAVDGDDVRGRGGGAARSASASGLRRQRVELEPLARARELLAHGVEVGRLGRVDDQHHREAPAEHRHLGVGDVQRVAEQRARDLGDDARAGRARSRRGRAGSWAYRDDRARDPQPRPRICWSWSSPTRPTPSRPPPHYHPSQDEHFEVLEGAIALKRRPRAQRRAGRRVLRHPARDGPHDGPGGRQPARVRWEVRPALRTEQFLTEMPEAFDERLAGPAVLGRVPPGGVLGSRRTAGSRVGERVRTDRGRRRSNPTPTQPPLTFSVPRTDYQR